MAIDLQTAKDRLFQARQDMEFYSNLVRLLGDPRLAGEAVAVVAVKAEPALPAFPIESGVPLSALRKSPHGEVRQKVYEALPLYSHKPMSTSQIFRAITDKGYTFISKHPIMAINDALADLQIQAMAKMRERIGVTNYWTRENREDG